MAAATSAITFDVADCKVSPLTADPTGGTTTWGSAVDVPGITEVSLEPNFITNELKGDGGAVLSKKGRIDRLNFSCTYGELSQNVLITLLGGSITAAGSSDSETASIDLTDASLPYFKVQFLITDLEATTALSAVHVTLQKCQLTGGSLVSGSTDTFNQPTFTAEAIKPKGTTPGTEFGSILFSEAAVTLS